ncbi:thymidylate kinase [bacterium]|nr:thymidylate kinase [bacterium]
MACLIAVEGIDGSGKGTQSARLVEELRRQGYSAALLSFPRYQATRFGQQIGHFLNGKFGDLETVHPLLVSLLFAGDRFESRALLLDEITRHDVVVCDRYVSSNMAHQGAKVSPEELPELLEWIAFVEYQQHQLPQPDVVLWFDLPVSVAQDLIARKSQRSYTEKAADLQEADAAYLGRVRDVYARLAEQTANWRRIPVTQENLLRDLDDVAAETWRTVQPFLPR